MKLPYSVYRKTKKKYCTVCGCILLPDHDSNICECCLDERTENKPEEDS